MSELSASGLPIKDLGIMSSDPLGVFVELAGESGSPYGSAEVFAAYTETLRRAAVARSRGLDLQRLRIDCVNAEGSLLLTTELPADDSWLISPQWSQPPSLSTQEVSGAVHADLADGSQAMASTVGSVAVDTDTAGYRVVRVTARADDPNRVWALAESLRLATASSVADLNAGGAQIALVWIDIEGSDGQILHLSWLDYQLAREGYWTDPSVPEVVKGTQLVPVAPGIWKP